MLKSEFLKDGSLIRYYSTNGMKIKQNETDIIYDEAIDTIHGKYTYTETEIPIESEIAEM